LKPLEKTIQIIYHKIIYPSCARTHLSRGK
jgi:hypothetical protein